MESSGTSPPAIGVCCCRNPSPMLVGGSRVRVRTYTCGWWSAVVLVLADAHRPSSTLSRVSLPQPARRRPSKTCGVAKKKVMSP